MQEHRDSQTPAGHRKLRVRHRMCKRSPPGPAPNKSPSSCPLLANCYWPTTH